MDARNISIKPKRRWWPLLSRDKAVAGEHLIGWLDAWPAARPDAAPAIDELVEPKPAAQPAPPPQARSEPLPELQAPEPPAPIEPSPEPVQPHTLEPEAKPAEPELEPEPKSQPAPRESLFSRLKRGLSRSAESLTGGISQIFASRKIDEIALEELEDLLIGADLGVAAARRLTDTLRESRIESGASGDEIKTLLADQVARVLTPAQAPLVIDPAHHPHVVLVVGVNGTGKTTTIGKLAQRLKDEGKSVMIAAGDTFRAAAIDQLKVWGERTGSPVIARAVGSDAAGLAFDALQEAKDQNIDVLLIDTAGRLQNKAGLMAELEKIARVIKKLDPAAPHSVVQVLDATTGQNAISQVEVFNKVAGVTGLIMTKLDGTARGGILVPLTEKFGLPIHAIGVGEAVEDLQDFDAALFARALAGLNETAPRGE